MLLSSCYQDFRRYNCPCCGSLSFSPRNHIETIQHSVPNVHCDLAPLTGGFQRLFDLITVPDSSGVIRRGEGPLSYAQYSSAEAPESDIVLVPGGADDPLA